MQKPLVLVILAAMLIIPAAARAAPESYIEENVTADFYMNGTIKADPSSIGYVSVSVGNNQDVLQYVETNLSWSGNTNLNIIPGTEANPRVRAHRSTAASPVIGTEKTRLYLNTTQGGEALYYEVSGSIAPLINVSMDYWNDAGGIDINSSLNTMHFTVNITSSSNIAGARMVFQVSDDVGGRDAMNIINAEASSYTIIQIIDTDVDGTYDRLVWTGDINAGSIVEISFEGNVQKGVNFDGSMFTFVDLSGSCSASYSQSQTFSGITFDDRFSRGPVRQGIDLIDEGTWSIQGFIRNMASGIVYTVNGWEIYEVGQPSPLASSSEQFTLSPGEIKYTTKHSTGDSQKKYYSSSFDWEINWGNSYYSGTTTSRIDMPVLYMIESLVDKNLILAQNTEERKVVEVQDTVLHLGDPSINVNVIRLSSIMPHLSAEGYITGWNPSAIRVIYRSGGNETDVTALASISYQGTTGTSDGYVNVTLNSSALGKFMALGDSVLLRYNATSFINFASNHTFGLDTVLITESGTPEYKSIDDWVFIGGSGPGPQPPGGGGGVAVDTAWIQKEDVDAYVILGNLADVKVVYGIYDTDGKGIRNIGLNVYIPEGGEMVEERTDLDLMVNGKWRKLQLGADYIISNGGVVLVGEKRYIQYTIYFTREGGLDLYNGDKIKIEYKSELPYGLNELITEAHGYNYYQDKIVSEEVHSLIRIGVKVSKFQYYEEEWVQGAAIVGRPVTWIKEYKVKNPNDVAAEDSFTTKIFGDSLSAYVVTEDGEKKELNIMMGSKVSWGIRMEPQEEKSVYLQVITPPVIEIWREVTPLFSNESWVNFEMNSTVRNFAMEDYTNVMYTLPCSAENVIYHEGLEGIIPGLDEASALLGFLESEANASFYLRYMQRPPILIVTTNGFNFSNEDLLEIKIIVIPTEREELSYVEIEAGGPVDPAGRSGKTIYGDMMSVEGEKGSINEFREVISLDSLVPGDYVLVTKFKKDFVTILTDEKEFTVGGGKLLFEIGYNILLLLLAVFVWFLFSRVERKKDEFREELRKLRWGRPGDSGKGIKKRLEGIKERIKRVFRRNRKESIYGNSENI